MMDPTGQVCQDFSVLMDIGQVSQDFSHYTDTRQESKDFFSDWTDTGQGSKTSLIGQKINRDVRISLIGLTLDFSYMMDTDWKEILGFL